MSQWSPDARTRPSAAAANGWLVVILVLLAAALLYRTLSDGVRNRPNYQPRVVTPRGELGVTKATMSPSSMPPLHP
ncbi:MAG UNVERIFIED_CONTAM: hypothetical protein LVR18_37665 [Planctomycetaceae bacterium]|jgi:hypothetical protein